MPRNFPDMQSLMQIAACHKFRSPAENETEEAYRTAVADHVKPIDHIESCEIRNKVGWDKFSDDQNFNMLLQILNK